MLSSHGASNFFSISNATHCCLIRLSIHCHTGGYSLKERQFKDLMLKAGWLCFNIKDGYRWKCKECVIIERKSFSGKGLLVLPTNSYGYIEDISTLSFHPDRLLITWNNNQEWYLPYQSSRTNLTCHHYSICLPTTSEIN